MVFVGTNMPVPLDDWAQWSGYLGHALAPCGASRSTISVVPFRWNKEERSR